jgi:type VI secretion system protein ImpH
LLTQQPRSAVTLEGLLRDYWDGIDFRVEQFVGRWVALRQPKKTSLGQPRDFGDLNCIGLGNSRLGVDLTVGEQVYDLSGKLKLVIGPLDWHTYETFLPDGYRYAETRALTRMYCKDPLAFAIEVILRPKEVPELCLSSQGDAGRLGYSSWVRTDELPETEVMFDVAGAPTASV